MKHGLHPINTSPALRYTPYRFAAGDRVTVRAFGFKRLDAPLPRQEAVVLSTHGGRIRVQKPNGLCFSAYICDVRPFKEAA